MIRNTVGLLTHRKLNNIHPRINPAHYPGVYIHIHNTLGMSFDYRTRLVAPVIDEVINCILKNRNQ